MSEQSISRIFAEKRPGFDTQAQQLCGDFKHILGIDGLKNVRLMYRYDFPETDAATRNRIISTVFSEPNADIVWEDDEQLAAELAPLHTFAVEYLPGQFDQHADSAAQCVQLVTGEKPDLKVARIIALDGEVSQEEIDQIKHYMINPVDSREASMDAAATLKDATHVPDDIETIEDFTQFTPEQLENFRQSAGFAMSPADLTFIQDYFKNDEQRDPTVTELRVIDTYWSDHCRHTTFLTNLDNIEISPENQAVARAYEAYKDIRNQLYGEDTSRPFTLMDLAVIGTKALKKDGKIPDLDESEEINACSVNIKVDHDGKPEDWLLMFKNETHNHPTEIEPFGGAATCLGGAIRDPLSGRAYVYQAMRLTGAWDPRAAIEDTIPGKLPQRKISREAADGYSSYGNQIGLATGQVTEVYHPGFLAKRLEVGAVIAAVPKENVIREVPDPGDVVLLIGGRTGRDGCGGATGSSKAHTHESIEKSGAEVQKGNPVVERKIQRLFRDPELAKLIRRCNDFGAGGVSVAVGELADSLDIDLDTVPKKYEGLDGTELAISESQERMAIVVHPQDVQTVIDKGRAENLEVTRVAVVTDDGRLKMKWRGKTILDLSRAFLNTNGAEQHADVNVAAPQQTAAQAAKNPLTAGAEGGAAARADGKSAGFETRMTDLMTGINTMSQKGLGEMFDGTIGAASVLMPYGGTYALTPQDGMAAKIPVGSGETTTCSVMSYGYAPFTAEKNPYLGGAEAVVRSLSKLACLGADPLKARLSFQEYFEHLGSDPEKWGRPFAALLGALQAQLAFGTPAIGGKDSMSGTFEELTVPPTIISFAVGTEKTDNILSAELKQVGSRLYFIGMPMNQAGDDYDYDRVIDIYKAFYATAQTGKILSAKTVTEAGIAEAAALMSFGNRIGIDFSADEALLFAPENGGILFEVQALPAALADFKPAQIGTTSHSGKLRLGDKSVDLEALTEDWEAAFRNVYPEKADVDETAENVSYTAGPVVSAAEKFAAPRILIPAFPGTNCEYDTAHAFERAGGVPEISLFRNQNGQDIEDSVADLVNGIRNAQIIALPGGFSAGDQPDGSGKFIAAVFRNPDVQAALADFLDNRGGLMLGICNGFQALIKLGLVPYGKITDIREGMPTLTHNAIGRHVSTIPLTKVVSNKSPWLAGVSVGDTFRIPMSHGEGRFTASDEVLEALIANGQIATQYVDMNGNATMDGRFNPNGSRFAVEGITSADGRILGKMGHSERIGRNLYKNIPGQTDQKIFESGVRYFK
ncbi:MAG: phosphoribosylformylglycinamidine synthase [Eubacteriaceae bacterium]|jgi:phosphoribosylformylglycinamidine synthase